MSGKKKAPNIQTYDEIAKLLQARANSRKYKEVSDAVLPEELCKAVQQCSRF